MQTLIQDRRFALVELILIILSGAVWMIKPEWGIWFILIALLPLALRYALTGHQFTWVDFWVLVFAVTAWVGYWAAYDQIIAWRKVWWIMTGILFYFSLKSQPQGNKIWVSTFFFLVGSGVALYYFLTHDFVAAPRKLEIVNQIGRWIMDVRPDVEWSPIHPNYVAGMIAVTVPFILYPVLRFKKDGTSVPVILWFLIGVGVSLAGFALVMATSRGVVLAIVSGLGGWLGWRFIDLSGINRRLKNDAVFPILLFVYLGIVVAFLYIGPARSSSLFTGNYYYGDGSRAELFSRSLYLLFSFPFTGGGLGSFPGLYSHYLLGIPFFNVPNSHNLFLDVAIEQGVFGGLSFAILYVVSVWAVAGSIARDQNDSIFNHIVLFALIVAIVHGMVDDYLYNGIGAMFALYLVGLVMNEKPVKAIIARRNLDVRTITVIAVVWLIVIAVNLNQLRGAWYANLGAVELAKVELKGFPNTGWAGYDIVPKLDSAIAPLRSSVRFDPANRTANQRLGLISMLQWDFQSAVLFLERARMQAPNHRGIIKSLGYCYVWLGEMENAQTLLSDIPEAKEELDVYTRWWETQGRGDLSARASDALKKLSLK